VPCRLLGDEAFILPRAGCERIVLAALAAGGAEARVAYEVAEARTIMMMVAEGLGVSVMPRLATGDAPDGIALRPLRPAARRTLRLATLVGRHPAPAVQALLDHFDAWRDETPAPEAS
jgi:DNA-binding transcriptional LysR family regulator